MNQDLHYYNTLQNGSTGEYKDKGSRFLGFATGVSHSGDIRQHLDRLRLEHPKARHHCYAWRLGTDGNSYRANDDQEPAGSAGKPILGQIDSAGLTQVLVVVVRYFGGTKLGVPGLIQAYKSAAAEAISAGHVVQKKVVDAYSISVDLGRMGDVERLFKQIHAEVMERQFNGSTSTFLVLLPRESAAAALEKLQMIDYQAHWELRKEPAP